MYKVCGCALTFFILPRAPQVISEIRAFYCILHRKSNRSSGPIVSLKCLQSFSHTHKIEILIFDKTAPFRITRNHVEIYILRCIGLAPLITTIGLEKQSFFRSSLQSGIQEEGAIQEEVFEKKGLGRKELNQQRATLQNIVEGRKSNSYPPGLLVRTVRMRILNYANSHYFMHMQYLQYLQTLRIRPR